MYIIFHINHELLFPKTAVLTTIFSTQMRGEEVQPQEHQHPCLILLKFHHSSPLLFKNHKNPEVDKKIQTYKTFTLTKGFVLSSCRCSKQSVSCLLTLNWSKHFIWWVAFKFVVETIIHHYRMLVKSYI